MCQINDIWVRVKVKTHLYSFRFYQGFSPFAIHNFTEWCICSKHYTNEMKIDNIYMVFTM
jgi:elongation factor P hydroxylase